VTGTCAAGSSIRVINADGSVVCETDDGTVTNVGTGSGLTGGPITTTGTISIATGGVTAAHVNSSQIQLRVTGVCGVGSSVSIENEDGSVVCQVDANSGGTVTSVGTGSGLTGGPITTSGTISIAAGGVTSAHIADGTVGAVDVNSAQVQLRVTGSCAPGSAIQAVNENGAASCQSVGGGAVTAVTASAPLVSSGGATPNISLPNVTIDTTISNTAIGAGALQSNTTGSSNTASGAGALQRNTTGLNNTASGFEALAVNTTGLNNTAIGFFADVSAGGLTNATAIGAGAIVNASNKIRLGNSAVTEVEGAPYSVVSDKAKKENFQPVDGDDV